MIIFDCLESIEVYSQPLICLLLCPELSAEEISYCGKILMETDLTDFIDLVSCTDWSMTLNHLRLLKLSFIQYSTWIDIILLANESGYAL